MMWHLFMNHTRDQILSRAKGRDIFIGGCPMPNAYFKLNRGLISRQFVLEATLADFAQKYLGRLRDNFLERWGNSSADVTFVAVHIRRGDYIRHIKALADGRLVSSLFFLKAMDIFR